MGELVDDEVRRNHGSAEVGPGTWCPSDRLSKDVPRMYVESGEERMPRLTHSR